MGDEKRPQLSHCEREGEDIDDDDDNVKNGAAAAGTSPECEREAEGRAAPVPVRRPKSRSSGVGGDDVHDEDQLDLVLQEVPWADLVIITNRLFNTAASCRSTRTEVPPTSSS